MHSDSQTPSHDVEPMYTADELENSFPLAQARRFAHQSGHQLVADVLAGMDGKQHRVRARKGQDSQRAATTVEALLANLVAGHLNALDADRFVAVSFNKEFYVGSDLSLKTMRDCRDYLHAEDMIEIGRGFSRPDLFGDGRFGRRTRLRASAKLRAVIDNAELGKWPLSLPVDQLIRIKEPSEALGAPPERVEASRATIQAVNRRLAHTDIAVRSEVMSALIAQSVEDTGQDADVRRAERRYAGDLTATSIYRSFKGDWQSGGRFYGGWWMSFPKVLRPYITINGEPVVELDYKTLHPLLLYRRAGLNLDFDPYMVYPWGGKVMRTLGKRTFNRLLNRSESDSTKRLKIRAADGDPAILPKGVPFHEYCSSLVAQLAGIQQWLGTREGVRLQFEDSQLALAVMAEMEDAGIPILPVHDSFIVAESHEEALMMAMIDAFVSNYGEIPEIERQGAASGLFPGTPREP